MQSITILTSGAMYSGVPHVDFDTDCTTSFLLNPKSHSFSCGRGQGPCSSILSSCMRWRRNSISQGHNSHARGKLQQASQLVRKVQKEPSHGADAFPACSQHMHAASLALHAYACACRYLDVAVGNPQAVAVVHSDDELLEDPPGIVLRHVVDLHTQHSPLSARRYLWSSVGATTIRVRER